MKYNKKILTFGTWEYYDSIDYLKQSAKKYGNVNDCFLFKESDIDTEFYKLNSKLFKEKRGFGFWCWKSHLINKMLHRASDNDLFLYIDAGNEILNDLTPLYESLIEDERGVILFNNADGNPNSENWKNINWTKSDCFNLLGLNSSEYIYGNQVNASYILFKKTNFSQKFFKLFEEACTNYNIISDAPNITPNLNLKEFRDHRHDQSILSLLAIRYKLKILRDPSQWGNPNITADCKYGQLLDHHRRKYHI